MLETHSNIVESATSHYHKDLKIGTEDKPLTPDEVASNAMLKQSVAETIARADEHLIRMEARFTPHLVSPIAFYCSVWG